MTIHAQTITEPELTLSPDRLIGLCRHFGLPVPAEALPGEPGCWLKALPAQDMSLAAASGLLTTGQVPVQIQAQSGLPALALVPESWGCTSLEENFPDDLTYELSGSDTRGSRYEIKRLDSLEANPDQGLPHLFAQVRYLLGSRDWLVYWGRSLGQVYLLGIFPSGWQWQKGPWIDLPDAPLPYLPTPLCRSLLQRAGRDWLESLDPQLRETEAWAYDWFETLAGRLLLPSTRFQALLGYTPGQASPMRIGVLGNLATIRQRLRRLTKEIWAQFVVSHSRFQGNLQQLQEIYRQFLPAYLELGAMIRSLASGLEANQTLAGYLSDHLNPATRLHDQLIPLWERVQDWLSEESEDPREPGQLTDLLEQADFRRSWQLMMGQYGHFAPFGLDLALPRFLDQPETLLKALAQPWSTDDYTVAWNRRGLLDGPRWQQLARLIDLREAFVADVCWALHQIRQRLEAHAAELVSVGRIANLQDIWWLLPDELTRLDTDHDLPVRLVPDRQAAHARWHRTWHELAASHVDVVLQGQGLQVGVIQGQVLCLDRPAVQLPEGFEPASTILITDTVDAGWIPCLEQVAGVILTTGDILSASAMLLRELSKPAIIGLPAAAVLQSGQWLRLNTETGTVSELSDPQR